MIRIGLILLTCLLVAISGCSDDDVDANGDAGPTTEDTGVDQDTDQDTGDAAQDADDAGTDTDTDDAGTDTDPDDAGDADASQDTDISEDTGPSNGGDVDEDTVKAAGDFVRTFLEADGRAFRYNCECWWEMSDYDDEQECLDDTDYVVADDDIDDAAQCFEDAVEDHGESAPQSAIDTLECLIDAAGDYERCEEDLRDEYDDICAESAAQSLEQCDDQWYDAVSEKCEPADDAGDDWLDNVFDAAGDAECFVGLPFW